VECKPVEGTKKQWTAEGKDDGTTAFKTVRDELYKKCVQIFGGET